MAHRSARGDTARACRPGAHSISVARHDKATKDDHQTVLWLWPGEEGRARQSSHQAILSRSLPAPGSTNPTREHCAFGARWDQTLD